MWLVTGATGHIGNVLVRELLARGEKVRALILPGESRDPTQRSECGSGRGRCPRFGFRLPIPARHTRHLPSGRRHLDHARHRIQSSDRVNVDGTKNLLKAAYEAGIQKFVYTSSIHAIQRAEGGVIDEALPYDADNHYGEYDRSKAEATLEVQKAAHAGLEAVIACPTGVIGPYDFRGSMMGSVIRGAAEQKPTLYVDGAYDFVDVRDVARRIDRRLRERQARRKLYSFGSTHHGALSA